MAYKAYRSSILFPVFLLSLPSVTLSRVNQVFCLLAGTRHRLLVDPEAAPGKLPTPATLTSHTSNCCLLQGSQRLPRSTESTCQHKFQPTSSLGDVRRSSRWRKQVRALISFLSVELTLKGGFRWFLVSLCSSALFSYKFFR